MKIYCNQEILLSHVNIVLKACSTRTTMPILECILIKAVDKQVTLVGNNLELGIQSTFETNVVEQGCIAVEAKIFSEIVRKMPLGDIEITLTENNMINILSGKSKFTILGQPGNDFPELPEVDNQVTYLISQLRLKEMIRQTIFSVAQEESRPIFTGEMFHLENDEFHLVSIDGFRLSYRCVNLLTNNTKVESVVPGKTLNEVAKILNTEGADLVNISFGEHHILFDLGNSKIVSRLLEGEFLNYNQVFPNDYQTRVIIDRRLLLTSIERAALITREGKKNPIKIDLNQESMIISSNTELGTAREEIEIELEGEPLTIAFNPRYLIEALKSIDDDLIAINFLSTIEPCIIKPTEGDAYKYLILPIRVN
ncbi:MAG: DNA polymerase III subunit beta [Epulopiscium sp. Nele67-Bin004]|nr:MAG: DNA polymerase III subunit beta [Epulopiscium sp. Nele67-Bin004]